MMKMTSPAVLLMTLLVATTGCSGSSGGTPPAAVPVAPTASASPSSLQEPLEKAVRSYSTAYLSGDGPAAYAILSARCKARVTLAQFTSMTKAAKAQYGDQKIVSLKVDTLATPLARVSYTYTDHALDQATEPWVYEGDAWHEDDC